MSELTKTCPACAEEIKAAAKICPHCRLKQVRFAMWRQDLIGFGLALVSFGTLAGLIHWLDLDSRVNGKIKWHGGDLEVVAPKIAATEKVNRGRFLFSGQITNSGTHAWRAHAIEVRLLSADGALRDTEQFTFDQPFVVNPGTASAFCLDWATDVPAAGALKIWAKVVSASDGNAILEP